jgi:hypothetical protein
MGIVDGGVVDSCPGWVGAAFADLYPDDAITLPTEGPAIVLASDEDWDFIAQNSRPVADAVDHLMRLVDRLTQTQWAVCTSCARGAHFVVCAAPCRPGYHAPGVGSVVVFGRPTAPVATPGSGLR